jgi:hypothetical protein
LDPFKLFPERKGRGLNRKLLFEVALCLVISLISLYEGFDLTFHREITAVHYGTGPGLYLLIVSMILAVAAIAHLMINWKKPHGAEKVAIPREMRMKLFSTIGNCILYILLINLVGYLVSTLVFFLLQFRIQGIRFWFSLLLTFIISTTFYLVFVKYCSLIFPRGILRIGFGL